MSHHAGQERIILHITLCTGYPQIYFILHYIQAIHKADKT